MFFPLKITYLSLNNISNKRAFVNTANARLQERTRRDSLATDATVWSSPYFFVLSLDSYLKIC